MAAVAEKIFDEIETPIGGVMPEQVMQVWSRVEPLLRRVVKPHTGYSLESVLTDIQLARSQLWVIGDFQAVAITEIQVRPLHKVLWGQFLVGDRMDEWLDDWIKVQDEFARQQGCVAVEFNGRKGWNRLQSKYRKWKPVQTTFRREL